MSGDAIRCYETAWHDAENQNRLRIRNHLFARMAMAESNGPSKYWEK